MPDEDKAVLDEMARNLQFVREQVADLHRKTDEVLKGFPAGDPDGHRRYHEEVMQQMAERRRLRQELLTHLLKAASWPALVGVFIVLWKYAKSQFFNH